MLINSNELAVQLAIEVITNSCSASSKASNQLKRFSLNSDSTT
jgi:hypothetical protein